MLKEKGHGFQKPDSGQPLQSPAQYVPQEELFDQGKKLILRRGGLPSQDGFYTASKIVREWAVVIQPTDDTLRALTPLGVTWGVFAVLQSGYISTSGVRINQAVNDGFGWPVPVVGTVIPVHGSFIDLKLSREVAAVAPQVDVEVLVYGLPGVPRDWNYAYFLIIVPASTFGSIAVPAFAWGFSISGELGVGDTMEQRTPDGTIVQAAVPVTSEYANFVQPIHPDTRVLRYTSPALLLGKRMLINFYFRS